MRDFVLFNGLLHEFGHHMIQHDTGKPAAGVMRTADHEQRADAFAAACRRAWTTSGALGDQHARLVGDGLNPANAKALLGTAALAISS